MATPAEELAAKWWKENVHFRGDHTGGMYMYARDYVDIVGWNTELLPEDFTGTVGETLAIKILTPVAQKFLEQEKEKDGNSG
jgi:hypothetical protein